MVEGNNLLCVRINDNGKGFHIQIFDEHTTHEGFGGNGLFKRRAENLGGKFRVESEIGEGTDVLLKIPLKEKMAVIVNNQIV